MIRCCLLLILLLIHTVAAIKPPAVRKKWLTLNGQSPLVVARGGLSGIFPESSGYGIDMTQPSSIPGVVMLCNLQLTRDGVGICQPDVKLDNSTNIDMIYPNQSRAYNLNGKDVTGWFSVDYTMDQLMNNVTVMQNVVSRSSAFDEQWPITTVDAVAESKFAAYWLNVQYDMFYTQHKLNMASYIQKNKMFRTLNYLSSPEIGFLKTMNGKLNKAKTKLVFVFLDKDAVEPSTNQTYGSILENLATIKSFASGIVVPKDYIWPVNKDNYLDKPTTLVVDAHKEGLEVYATGFANDYNTVYNYSYDPLLEYMNFIDNSQFAVDGVISDFAPSASAAVACYAQFSNFSLPKKGRPVIITHNGASGVYAGSTDLAYKQALADGADIIDCSVQMSKDGVAFCSDSADLTGSTTAIATFVSRTATIPEIQQSPGVFSFDLTWSEIQTLRPQLTSPFSNNNLLPRNPANKNAGKLVTLAEFLEFAKAKAASGILINIENAAYLASKKGLDLIGVVATALINATFDKQSTQKVLIQSDDTSVLSKFQNVPAYERVLFLKDEVSDAPRKPVDEIKKFADAVNVPRFSIIPTDQLQFALNATKVVNEMRDANLTVYVSVLRNEFIALAFDYFADPTIELATYTANEYFQVNGVVTEYPATANRYLTNICSDLNYDLEYAIMPISPPMLVQFAAPQLLPPLPAPKPILDAADVVDPPLPAVAKISESSSAPAPTTGAKDSSSAALASVSNLGLCLVATLVLGLFSMGY